jgi:hypothetical protein
MRVARPTSKESLGPADPQTEQLPRWHLERAAFAILLPTVEGYRHRAEEAKNLAKRSQDVWEREILLRVATQWQLLAAHREVKESKRQAHQ